MRSVPRTEPRPEPRRAPRAETVELEEPAPPVERPSRRVASLESDETMDLEVQIEVLRTQLEREGVE